jgi:hypothetical protein
MAIHLTETHLKKYYSKKVNNSMLLINKKNHQDLHLNKLDRNHYKNLMKVLIEHPLDTNKKHLIVNHQV